MREILFRARDKGTDEWVYGYYYENPSPFHKGKECSIFDDKTISKYSVYPETIGQYTGLTDKNGTKIFEGDILKHNFDDGFYDLLEVIYDNELAKFQYRDVKMKGFIFDMVVDIETVVGNIHDNPELLKGAEQ